MSMRPFMSYAEGEYAAHWLRIVGAATEQPIFAHVNWFQKDPDDGHFLWPGYRDNLRPLLWLMQLKDGEVERPPHARRHHADRGGAGPRRLHVDPGDLATLLAIDVPRWREEMGFREEHLRAVRRPPRGDLGGAPPGRGRAGRHRLRSRAPSAGRGCQPHRAASTWSGFSSSSVLTPSSRIVRSTCPRRMSIDPVDAVATAGHEAVEVGPADQREPGAVRHRGHHVLART